MEKIMCENIVYDEERGEKICADTGEVLEEKIIDVGREWRSYTFDEHVRRSRAGMPLQKSTINISISTVLDGKFKDAKGKKFDVNDRIRNRRLVKLQRRLLNDPGSVEKEVLYIKERILAVKDRLFLTEDAVEQSLLIAKEAFDSGRARGMMTDCIAGAVIYLTCKLMKIPVSIEEIADALGLFKKDLGRCYRRIIEGIDVEKLGIENKTMITSYVSRIVSQLGLSGRTEALAKEIVRRYRELGLSSGKDPRGIEASAVYIASKIAGEPTSQEKIAETAGISEATLRVRIKEIEEMLKIHPLTS
jgi:transcription initiation factor TFIIB